MQCFLQLRKTFIFPLGPAFLGSQSHSPGAGAGGHRGRWLSAETPGRKGRGRRVALPPSGPGYQPEAPGPTSLPPASAGARPTPPKGASLTAPHETIIHYVTRREERECKCLDGIRGDPRRDDLGAVIIHLIGAWGKLLDREMELNQPRKGARQGCVGELASLAIFKRFHLRRSHKMQSYFMHLVWWPLAFLCMNIKFEMALQQHSSESVLPAVICMVGLVSRLLTF